MRCPSGLSATFARIANHVVWVDVSDPTGRDFLDLAEEFQFHPISIQDCRSGHQRPKVEEYPGYYLIVLYEAEWPGPRIGLNCVKSACFSVRTTWSRCTAVRSGRLRT